MIMSLYNTLEMSPWFTISEEVVDARGTIDEQERATTDTSAGESEDGDHYFEGGCTFDGC